MEDTHHYKNRLESAKRRIKDEKFGEEDRQGPLSFADFVLANGVSRGRTTEYLYHLITIRREMQCDFKSLDRREVENLMAWLTGRDTSRGPRAT